MPRDDIAATPRNATPIIVGIVASAGGLEAMSLFCSKLAPDHNCSFVLAQHVSPKHKSMLTNILSRETRLRVEEIYQNTRPQPDTIYVTPPGSDVEVQGNMILLSPPMRAEGKPKPSGDRLLASLAKDQGARAVGVILSGTGSDGSQGIQAIREAGGITIAQSPESCKYDSMPITAIRTSSIDLVLNPEEIGTNIAQIIEEPDTLEKLRKATAAPEQFEPLFNLLLLQKGLDFRHYKKTTIERRIRRRMLFNKLPDFDSYLDFCQRSAEELECLYRDLLISVTRFFRDKDHFDVLSKQLALLCDDLGDRPLRIWVPGCSTGEEAYSIGILAAEHLGGLDKLSNSNLQIFATDVDERNLARARSGLYSDGCLEEVPDQFRAYFYASEGGFAVQPRLRNCVKFSQHNIFQDAPFMNMDLVSFRNVLIYFQTNLQERIFERLHFALQPQGLLFLGSAESIGAMTGLFQPLDNQARIFTKKLADATSPGDRARGSNNLAAYENGSRQKPLISPVPDWSQFDALANAVVTNGFLATSDKKIVRVYGDLAPFCEVTQIIQDTTSLQLLTSVLSDEAANLIVTAKRNPQRRKGHWHRLERQNFNMVRMCSFPIAGDGDSDPLILIGIETKSQTQDPTPADDSADYTTYLEDELAKTRDILKITTEQLQNSNEILQSLNEELQGTNEELQSANEELETTNEELQSTNEELITVNEELLISSNELQYTSIELQGLIDGLPTATMLLDPGLLIRQASARAHEIFHIRAKSTPMGHLSQCFLPTGFPSLVDLCTTVVTDKSPISMEFDSKWGHYDLMIMPLMDNRSVLQGIIVHVGAVQT
ncbi:MAG: chemotaxis protein CheB [Mangrovicoccus sp.]